MTKDELIELEGAKKEIKDDVLTLDADNVKDMFSGEVALGRSVGGAVVNMFNDNMKEGDPRISAGGLQRTEKGFVFKFDNNTTKPVAVYEEDGITQLPDDVIAQNFADALGIDSPNVRQKFKAQLVNLGDFNPIPFTTYRSEPAMRAPMYNRGINRADPDSPNPQEFLKEQLGSTVDGGYWSFEKTDAELADAYNQLITSYWNPEKLGGVGLVVNNKTMTVTINGEVQAPMVLEGDDSPGEIWQKLKEMELKVRLAKDEENSGETPKRTITQIMEEDSVDRVAAIEIFNAQQ